MSSGELLNVEPLEMKFPFELKKQISCSLQVSNKTENYVAFKVKTTNPKKYCVRPNTGIVLPRSTCDIVVTMQAQKEAPADMQCKDKFLLQSVVASAGATAKDITAEMFNKEQGQVEECKLKVVYVAPPQPPSPVAEGSEEGFSQGPLEWRMALRGKRAFSLFLHIHSPELLLSGMHMARSLVSKLTEEKAAAIQRGNKLRQELELLKRESNRSGGVSITFVIIIGLLGIVLGYLMKDIIVYPTLPFPHLSRM
ncbi:UNVERIFIED_CONTAM: Vesicle-associated protein 1-1 [Sesamum calycinum]|uniref:Vesicle-associated protein 1-1 n=1 Tax=Sesamum calycinum TaxID=2727403 RepID=A0AAW2LZ64_9LAMI